MSRNRLSVFSSTDRRIFSANSHERRIYDELYQNSHVGTPRYDNPGSDDLDSNNHSDNHVEENLESESTENQAGAFQVNSLGIETRCQRHYVDDSVSIVEMPLDYTADITTTYSTTADNELDQEPDHLAQNSLRPSSIIRRPSIQISDWCSGLCNGRVDLEIIPPR